MVAMDRADSSRRPRLERSLVMFRFLRKQVRSEIDGSEFSGPILENLEMRALFSALADGIGLGIDPVGAALISSPSTFAGGGASANSNVNGAAGQLPAFYDGQTFTVNMMELPDD